MNKVPDKAAIDVAANRIQHFIHKTPILTSRILNEATGANLFLKCENLQKAGAFKSRGAVNALFSLSEIELKKGVCTHSSGNHAAALARAAALRNTKAYIVMPENSPTVKVDAVKYYGGQISFCAPNLAARESTLKTIQLETGAIEIHPYNNFTIIAGQATAAREIFLQLDMEPDFIIAPVGGGGLLSGTALSANYFSGKTKVIAAEPKGADDAYRSFKAGEIIPSENPVTIADGLLTSLGSKTFPIIMEHVHRIFTVEEHSIVKAMKFIWERMKIVIEPSSAVAVAAVFENKAYFEHTNTALIISGGNCDLNKLPWLT
ncbi:MAG: pyridoxal-phosphate dependent enzyme [Bacteroidales bacterium]|nr:pyridoxal-phosphate dependent enzyme [Bacteroidales bacterium]